MLGVITACFYGRENVLNKWVELLSNYSTRSLSTISSCCNKNYHLAISINKVDATCLRRTSKGNSFLGIALYDVTQEVMTGWLFDGLLFFTWNESFPEVAIYLQIYCFIDLSLSESSLVVIYWQVSVCSSNNISETFPFNSDRKMVNV